MPNEPVMIYTIVATGIDVDRGNFPEPEAKGSYLSEARAREKLHEFIEAEKEELDSRYDQEDYSETYWESYADGYAAALFSRLEILSAPLDTTDGAPQTQK